MHENNKDIGWEKNYNNVGSDGNYDDTLIKNQISTLNNKVNELDEETEQKANKNELHKHNNKDVLDSITEENIEQWNKGEQGEQGKSISIVILTQEEYEALEVKDDYTFYGIKED